MGQYEHTHTLLKKKSSDIWVVAFFFFFDLIIDYMIAGLRSERLLQHLCTVLHLDSIPQKLTDLSQIKKISLPFPAL